MQAQQRRKVNHQRIRDATIQQPSGRVPAGHEQCAARLALEHERFDRCVCGQRAGKACLLPDPGPVQARLSRVPHRPVELGFPRLCGAAHRRGYGESGTMPSPAGGVVVEPAGTVLAPLSG